MIRNVVLFWGVLILLAGLGTGCSDDTSRITNSQEVTPWSNILSSGTEEPDVTFDIQEYFAEGDYYPGEIMTPYDNPEDQFFEGLGHPSDYDFNTEKDLEEAVR